MDGVEIIRRCRLLAQQTEDPGHITRTFLSPPMHEVHRMVRSWMEAAGMRTRVDSVGNLLGVYGDGSRLMIGSHLDTVPHAGAFDGILGVMIAIALVAERPPCAVEVAAFSEEEGVRFGVPFIGSRALVGDPVMDERVFAAIDRFGLDPARIPEAVLDPAVKAYLEFHIEQGPVLEKIGAPLGVVEAIAGLSRWELRFEGKANHAGTTPMDVRQDALACAAEWIGLVEHVALNTEGLVATVGKLEVLPGAGNVIPGLVTASLDVRHPLGEVRDRALNVLLDGAEHIAQRRGLSVTGESQLQQAPVPLHFEMVERAVATTGFPVHRMTSGAGHDAMILARKVPAAMLFLRSPGGISHHPGESVLPEDVEAALKVGGEVLRNWCAASSHSA
ncbi:MAG TPA: Zn-dependent hydrolase [Bryobacteraceae bacterium]|jgi:allantoate deiminase|nr:Zn-dependent hydrolase [Bryobacteraceae bacterium]